MKKHGLLIWLTILGLGFFILIFMISKIIGEYNSIFETHEEKISNVERQECINWLVEYDVAVVPPLVEGPRSDSKADLTSWIDNTLYDLPIISIRDSRIRDEDLRYLYYLSGVRWLLLDTDTTKVTPAGFQQLYHCTKLEIIYIEGSSIVPCDWVKVLASNGMVSDWNFSSPISDQSLCELCNSQSHVKSLSIHGNDNITENGYQSIGMLCDLEDLMIYGKKPFMEKEIKHILNCTKLKKLCILGDVQISDELIKALIFLPALKELDLNRIPHLSRETLAIICSRPLQELNVISPQVADCIDKHGINVKSAMERLAREAGVENESFTPNKKIP